MNMVLLLYYKKLSGLNLQYDMVFEECSWMGHRFLLMSLLDCICLFFFKRHGFLVLVCHKHWPNPMKIPINHTANSATKFSFFK